MKKFVLIAGCVAAVAMAAPANAIEVVSNEGAVLARPLIHPTTTAPLARIVLPHAQLVTLPEPEVFAMMLLGLVLIGYRTSRHSDEKFQ